MMKEIIVMTTLVLVAVTSQITGQVTAIFQPGPDQGKDAVLHGLSSQSENNFGATGQLAAMDWTFLGTPGTIRSVIQFGLSTIPEGSVIASAQLSLFAWGSDNGFGKHSGENACYLQRVTSPWDEETVTWVTQPNSVETNQVSINSSENPDQNFENIDVLQLVQDMIDNPSESHGFMLRLKDEEPLSLMNFASSDNGNSELHPKLVVIYYPPVDSDDCISLRPSADDGKDAILHGLSSEVDKNFENQPQFLAATWTFSGSQAAIRSVIEFDFSTIPENAIINSAYLSLYAWDSDNGLGMHSGENATVIKRITSDWNENTVTWNTSPSTTDENQVLLSTSESVDQNYINVNVVDLVKSMIGSSSNNFGFMLQLEDEEIFRLMNFASSDHPDPSLHPSIEICYSIPTGSKQTEATSFQIWPNPAEDIVNIHFQEADLEGTILKIYNYQGQLVKSFLITSTSMSINMSDFNSGIYFVNIGNNQTSTTRKLIID